MELGQKKSLWLSLPPFVPSPHHLGWPVFLNKDTTLKMHNIFLAYKGCLRKEFCIKSLLQYGLIDFLKKLLVSLSLKIIFYWVSHHYRCKVKAKIDRYFVTPDRILSHVEK